MVEKVKWQINRDSAEHKLRDFLEWMEAVKRDTLYHVSLRAYYKLKCWHVVRLMLK